MKFFNIAREKRIDGKLLIFPFSLFFVVVGKIFQLEHEKLLWMAGKREFDEDFAILCAYN